jgi:hypothetical protein
MTKRIKRSVLDGDLRAISPCLLLARSGARFHASSKSSRPRGLFEFATLNSSCSGLLVHSGLILPLSCCRDLTLQEHLHTFAGFLALPIMAQTSGKNGLCMPPDARSRRRALQQWLDDAGLGLLRLLDKEPLHCWTKLALTPAVFQQVLSLFDYVSALEFAQDKAARIVDRTSFDWASHCELLEWCRSGDDEDDPLYPFGLYLATEVSIFGTAVRTHWECKPLFRPDEYWVDFSVPKTNQPTAPVEVHLELDRWRLRLGERTAEVSLPDLNYPLSTLLEWLQRLATGDLPIGFDVDDEGDEVRILAHGFGGKRLLVAILDLWKDAEPVIGVVDTDAFLAAFRRELNDLLRNRFDIKIWSRLYSLNDHEQKAYHDLLLRHPFLVGAANP